MRSNPQFRINCTHLTRGFILSIGDWLQGRTVLMAALSEACNATVVAAVSLVQPPNILCTSARHRPAGAAASWWMGFEQSLVSPFFAKVYCWWSQEDECDAIFRARQEACWLPQSSHGRSTKFYWRADDWRRYGGRGKLHRVKRLHNVDSGELRHGIDAASSASQPSQTACDSIYQEQQLIPFTESRASSLSVACPPRDTP
jgi:hypothetical protein